MTMSSYDIKNDESGAVTSQHGTDKCHTEKVTKVSWKIFKNYP